MISETRYSHCYILLADSQAFAHGFECPLLMLDGSSKRIGPDMSLNVPLLMVVSSGRRNTLSWMDEMEDGDGPRNCSRFQCGGESGVVGPLAARGIAEGDWTSVWQDVIVDFSSGGPLCGNSPGTASSFAIGIDAFGARGDIPRYCGGPIDALDGQVAGPLALDGEPRNKGQRRAETPPGGGGV